MVLAGAGTGKTRVITHRIAHLVENGVPAKRICAVTFTNKAAGEMRERVAALLAARPADAAKLRLGTFHSLGLYFLRKEHEAVGLPKRFAIYDTSDQLGVLREICRRAGLGRRYDLKAVLSRISLAKNEGILPEDYDPQDFDEYDEATEVLYPKYQEQLQACAAVDFDDLILLPTKCWAENPDVGHKWREMYDYVLVDEFQDSNRSQLAMVHHLVSKHGQIFAVGDDDQSIYGWRGAEPRNILDFQKVMADATVVRLEENYRSSPVILHAANQLIENNTDRLGKTLRSERTDREAIVHAVAPTSDEEAEYVADEIQRLKNEIGCTWSSFAILYRSNNLASRFEEALRARQIPYEMLGGQQFFERKEVKDLLAYLRAILSNRDELALRRIINYPARGIGAKTVLRATSIATDSRIPLEAAFERLSEESTLRKSTRTSIKEALSILSWARENIETATIPTIRDLMKRIGLYDDIRDASPTATAAQKRIDNVEHLLRSITGYMNGTGEKSLLEFIRFLSLANTEEEKLENSDRVTLATLHSSKGLEFPTVFLVGLEDGIIPHQRTLQPSKSDIFDPEKIGDISEERRLAYVGITRAKKRLYLTRSIYRAMRGGKPSPQTPSRFLFEIPEDELSVIDIAETMQASVPSDEVRNFFKQLALD